MTDGLLYKKDTDFVRDNMLINYCLGDDESLLIESFVRNNGICLRFDVGRFYFFMTGTHKKFVTGYTPMTFSEGVDSALAIYDLMLETLRQNGFDGNAFLVKIDNSKQVGVLFSPRARRTKWHRRCSTHTPVPKIRIPFRGRIARPRRSSARFRDMTRFTRRLCRRARSTI